MKARNIIIGILAVVISLSVWYEHGWAQAKEEVSPTRVAVVSVRRILENSKTNARWEEKLRLEGEKIRAELEKLSKEIQAIDADMATRKIGSSDYLDLMRSGTEKQALLEAKDKFYQQELGLKQQQQIERLYQEIIVAASKVAKQKGIDMVVAKEEFQFPSASLRELTLVIQTSKVLYHAEHMDITNEVLEVLDKEK
ncbi:MAG: OmpH/Skp family outer membrane protein [Planctomycetota bacterium]|jgi:Skp family chaperone for outer membrane proteins